MLNKDVFLIAFSQIVRKVATFYRIKTYLIIVFSYICKIFYIFIIKILYIKQ